MPSNDDLPPGALWDVEQVLTGLRAARHQWRSAHWRNAEIGAEGFPSRRTLEEVMMILCGVLFPLRLGPSYVRQSNEDAFVAETLENGLGHLYGQLRRELTYSSADGDCERIDADARRIMSDFAAALPEIRVLLDKDVEAAFAGDPAAASVDEVLLCYPCLLAIIHYRLANHLHGLGAPLVARIITEIAHSRTGIDVHPGAQIGERFFIDHGTGVVIGETAVIGHRVRLYQAVTLGALTLPSDHPGDLRHNLARHPIVEDDVVIYPGATLLGRITIGRGSMIGGNVWLTTSVPPGSFVDQGEVRFGAGRPPGAVRRKRSRAMNASSQKPPSANCVDNVAGASFAAPTFAPEQERQMFDEGLGRSPLCLTIPGLGNSGPEHWQSIWERDRRDCERVPLGCWDQPSRNVWVGRIDQAVRAAPCQVVLVAHSLGCLAVVWWATMMGEATANDVVGALLVAPPDVDASGDPRLTGFAPTPRALLPFPSIVVASRDDRWCGFERSQDLAAGWGADFVDIGNAGHINGESDLGRWAEGQALLGSLLNAGEGRVPAGLAAMSATTRARL